MADNQYSPSDPSQWVEVSNYNQNQGFSENPAPYYQDPATGNIYQDRNPNSSLVASGEALGDKYAQITGADAIKSQQLYDLKNQNPDAYYAQVINDLNNARFNNYSRNDNTRNIQYVNPVLEELKDKNPQAYYQAQLDYLGKQMGWQYGQGTPERNASTEQELQSLIPQAKAAGLDDSQISSIIKSSIDNGASGNQQRISNEKAEGNFWTDNLIGTAKVGALALGAYGLDSALAAGASAMGPTYAELGVTGLEGGFAGPTYGELGFTGMNQSEAIALADAAASKGITLNDAYKAYNNAKKVANLLGKGGTAGQLGNASSSNSAMANALSQTPQAEFGGLYRMNQSPFLSNQQTALLSPDSYNVSGQNITSPTKPTNQMLANLLFPKA